jgi:hypothetical protein
MVFGKLFRKIIKCWKILNKLFYILSFKGETMYQSKEKLCKIRIRKSKQENIWANGCKKT